MSLNEPVGLCKILDLQLFTFYPPPIDRQLVKFLSVLAISTNSERSEECIDFTIIITSRNNAPISNYGGGFRCKSEYPWCIIEFSKKLRKTKKN
ncbi:Uncharacterized protein FWK35_00003445 [Aphis craccivora]|uniref:Uncharacterized protein n=1 Tax=Aphis craccivora TaxID=307492 RepID=A0A6G0Z616_APHCR|nr:Uncharacterized protein FWK35_00003445 [Aphis craccivora]